MNRQEDVPSSRELEIIDRIPGLRALVIGDVMLDIYEFCHTTDSKPIDSEKNGKRAYKAQETIKVLGGAGNVAANLASLDVHTSLAGVTGDDENYFKIRDLVDRHSICHTLIRDKDRPTTTKARLYLDGNYLLRRDTEHTDPLDELTSAALMENVLRKLPKTDVVILSDCAKGVFTTENTSQIIQECRLRGIPVVVDFKPVNQEFFIGADIIAPNAAEAAEIIGKVSLNNLKSDCQSIHSLLGCVNTVITLGEEGLCGIDADGFFHVPGHHVEPVDKVGCGDTVRAGLAIGTALGLSLKDAAILANDAATVIVQKSGTSVLSRQELQDFVSQKMKLEPSTTMLSDDVV